jgi:hypothetical protein
MNNSISGNLLIPDERIGYFIITAMYYCTTKTYRVDGRIFSLCIPVISRISHVSLRYFSVHIHPDILWMTIWKPDFP